MARDSPLARDIAEDVAPASMRFEDICRTATRVCLASYLHTFRVCAPLQFLS